MKKILCFVMLLWPVLCIGQVGIITTIAGNGTAGFTGDGGPATAAQFNEPYGIAFDNGGSMYIADYRNHRVRRISPSGVITSIAGNGSATFSGDGGAATAAGIMYGPVDIAPDETGNIYVSDNFRLRKINTSGIINTIAGTGTLGYTGDGGAATAANIYTPTAVTADHLGNVYIVCQQAIRKIGTSGIITTIAGGSSAGFSGDGGQATAARFGSSIYDIVFDKWGNLYLSDAVNNRIRKINTTGVVTTIAGTDSSGYSGDGGPATAARLRMPHGITVDTLGNVYFCDASNERIRKVNTSGIISTIAGNGTVGFSGDGGPSITAALHGPIGIHVDKDGVIKFSDDLNYRIRKIVPTTPFNSEYFSAYVTKYCGGLKVNTVAYNYSSSQHIKTFYGTSAVTDDSTSISDSTGIAEILLPLSASGNYTIKQVLYNGTAIVDSITYSHEYVRCQDIAIDFYYDADGNCTKNSSEHSNFLPVTAEVDSNGIPIDTISGTSGFYYTAMGNPMDVYTFNIISRPPGLNITCPSSGVISDTLAVGLGKKMELGFSCSSATSAFDLGEYMSSIAGRHKQSIDIVVNNTFCTPESATLVMHFSPRYIFESAKPTPASVVGNTITWNLDTVTAHSAAIQHIHVTLVVPGAWLPIGDTVQTNCVVLPTGGDYDTSNNVIIKVDTINGSWDPNDISVSPSGYILSGAQLQYTINFENTGNDTAFNIYVMDTLSDNVDPGSMRVIAASAVMNATKYYDTTIRHNIIKFEFPKINLLDSSHHNECDGFVVFNMKTRTGLHDSTSVFNHAGIFFDDNPVVMTGTVENITSLIHGVSILCQGAVDTLTEHASGGIWTVSNTHAAISSSGIITGMSAGIDTIKYAINYANGSITTQKIITINPLPNAGTITGADSICVAATTTLTSTSTGGAWRSVNTHATISGSGVVTGASAGVDTIVYVVSNSCGSDSVSKRIIIKPLPAAGSIAGADSVCVGATISLSATATGGSWYATNSHASITGAGIVMGISAGVDTIVYRLANFCGVDSVIKRIVVSAIPFAGSILGPDSVCEAAAVMLSDTVTTGIWSVANSHASVASGIASGILSGLDTVYYIVSSSCGRDTAFHAIVIKPAPHAGVISGVDSLCLGASVTLSETVVGGIWHVSNTFAGIAGGVVSGYRAGLDTVWYVIANSCGADTASFVVRVCTIPPIPAVTGLNYVCIGRQNDTLTGLPAGGFWSVTNANASVSGGVVTALATGIDTIVYTVANFCGVNYVYFFVSIPAIPVCDSISEVKQIKGEQEVNIYPNPITDELVIEAPLEFYSSISVFDLLGKPLIQQKLFTNITTINLQKLVPGVYYIKIEGKISDSVKKVIKM